MKQTVIVGDIEFSSKKSAEAFFRAIRDKYPDGARIYGAEDCQLRNLVAIHSEAETKVGCGIDHFTVETDPIYRSRHFQIHRVDGTRTDFSFRSAINGRNERKDKLEAMRQAIKPQILAFMNRCFETGEEFPCPLRGVPITPAECHVDHKPPRTFKQLVEDWLADQPMTLDEVKTTLSADNQYVAEMTNPAEIQSWTEFHMRYADLRLLSPTANLSDAKKR